MEEAMIVERRTPVVVNVKWSRVLEAVEAHVMHVTTSNEADRWAIYSVCDTSAASVQNDDDHAIRWKDVPEEVVPSKIDAHDADHRALLLEILVDGNAHTACGPRAQDFDIRQDAVDTGEVCVSVFLHFSDRIVIAWNA